MENVAQRVMNVVIWGAIGVMLGYSLQFNPVIGGIAGGIFGVFLKKGCGP